MKEEIKQNKKEFGKRELARFCMQVGLYLDSAIPLSSGFESMSEEAEDEQLKVLYKELASGVELGTPLHKVLESANVFPGYVVKMAKLGDNTGTLASVMLGLSDYYEKEYILMTNIKNAITYPIIMVSMLLIVLCFLFLKVMPIFMSVYESLGANVSSVVENSIKFGGILSLGAFILSICVVVIGCLLYTTDKLGYKINAVDKVVTNFKSKNKIALLIAKHRLAAVLYTGLNSSLYFEDSLNLAKELVANKVIEDKIEVCKNELMSGKGYSDAIKVSGLFTGYSLELIRTGDQSGHLAKVMGNLSDMYNQEADTAIDSLLSRFEPTIIAVLAVAVGLVLLSVMIPLAGVLASLG